MASPVMNPIGINETEHKTPTRNKTQTPSDDLTGEDMEKLRRQETRLVSSFQAAKLEQHAQKYWDQFYKRNTTKFFKDRHWTTREFNELLAGDSIANGQKPKILELGCGVGNLIFPLVEDGADMDIFACDFSPRAVEFVKNHELYNPDRVNVFQADITKDDLLERTKVQVDVITSVFVLSAIHPDNFKKVVGNISRVLKPGGLVLIRDYGIYDMTQIRFKPGHKISENFYMRQDGTRSFFFTTDILRDLFASEGFEEVLCCYVKSRTVNKKEDVDVPRTFVQGKFKKCFSVS